MTYQMRTLSRMRAAPAEPSACHSPAASHASAVAAARASTTLAMSIMVALRYLDGRPSRPVAAAPAAVPDPVLS